MPQQPAGKPARRRPSTQELEEARKTFVPMTGNPENGDYLDWVRHLEERGLEPCRRPP